MPRKHLLQDFSAGDAGNAAGERTKLCARGAIEGSTVSHCSTLGL